MTTFPATYCPDCGTELDERRVEGRDRRYCADCERVVWHNPVPGAAVGIVGDEGVLCTRRAIEPGLGDWAVPGGHMDPGETPPETAARELREEAGLRVDATDLTVVGTHTASYESGKHMVVVDYAVAAAAVDGDPSPNHEVDEVAWIEPSEIDGGGAFLSDHDRVVRRAWERFGER